MRFLIFIVIIQLFCLAGSNAQGSILLLDNENKKYSLKDFCDVFLDLSNGLGIDEVQQQTFHPAEKLDSLKEHATANAALWFRWTIIKKTNAKAYLYKDFTSICLLELYKKLSKSTSTKVINEL